MKSRIIQSTLLALLMAASGTSLAESNFGVGVKAGTLGLGLEGTWRPLPYLDLRFGLNQFDYDDDGSRAGVDYNTTLNLETFYATANFRFPLSPFRLTAGAYSNGNELNLVSVDSGTFDIGGQTYTAADVGTLTSKTSFSSTAPYVGVGYDFTVLNKVGLNLDFGVLWQGDPNVSVTTDGLLASDPTFLASLESERLELVEEIKDYKAWPVISLGFVYNF